MRTISSQARSEAATAAASLWRGVGAAPDATAQVIGRSFSWDLAETKKARVRCYPLNGYGMENELQGNFNSKLSSRFTGLCYKAFYNSLLFILFFINRLTQLPRSASGPHGMTRQRNMIYNPDLRKIFQSNKGKYI